MVDEKRSFGPGILKAVKFLTTTLTMTSVAGFQSIPFSQREKVLLFSQQNLTPRRDDDIESFILEKFKERKNSVERRRRQHYWQLPPNPLLEPVEFVTCVLDELRYSQTYSGVIALADSSSDSWRELLCKSVGAPKEVTSKELAPTLKTALARPNNQFAILMGVENQDYIMSFPTDALDFGDTCWLECRLRSFDDDQLLVVMGWNLQKRLEDGAWLISALDWQDFREAYRPGIGREEWERICG